MEPCIKSDDINSIKQSVESLHQSVERIEIALLGDKFNPNGGYMKRLEIVEKKQKSIDKKVWLYTGIITGISATLTFILKYIFK